MDYFKVLPSEITLDILSRAPTESVLECKLVCTSWRNLISYHPSFSKLHLDRLNHPSADIGELGFVALTYMFGYVDENEKLLYFEYNEIHESTETAIQRIRRINFAPPFEYFRIVGSFDGLICLTKWFQLAAQPVCIWNPITRECVVLPTIQTDCNCSYWTCGFGYVTSTNEYKVVGIHVKTGGFGIEFVQVHIYTLGSGIGWRNLGNFDSKFSTIPLEQAIFANGALYWLDLELKMFVTFDLTEEKFCEYLLPPPLPPNGYGNKIGVLDGFLFFAAYLDVEGPQCYDIWLLKKKNENDDTKEQKEHQSLGWIKEFRMDDSVIVAVTKSGGVLTYLNNHLSIYDTQASTSKKLVNFKERIRKVFPHKNTLLSLKELGEQDTKVMELVEVKETECYAETLKQLHL